MRYIVERRIENMLFAKDVEWYVWLIETTRRAVRRDGEHEWKTCNKRKIDQSHDEQKLETMMINNNNLKVDLYIWRMECSSY